MDLKDPAPGGSSRQAVVTLTTREAEQIRMEIAYLQRDARVRGPLLDHIYAELGRMGVPEAPYPGHRDVWPKGRTE